jgi:predicted Rossmann fold nucleotide-binding protein DprA/Smf involved in DNA uptake
MISDNTQAILLLTAPLIVGKDQAAVKTLSPGEYKQLARHLRTLQREPADFLSPDAGELVRACGDILAVDRLQPLLERGFLLTQAIEHWQARAIWVISRADPTYPPLLKSRLRDDAPAILYGCGDLGLATGGGLAVVGSRHVDDGLLDETRAIGQLAAGAGIAVISGGAKGIDQAAMDGALQAGGRVVGILANQLERAAMHPDAREALRQGRLLLTSPYDPSAGFHVGNAMQRNKLIYALADAALVMNSDLKGGTWTGAKEQLDKRRLVPVYVRSTGAKSPGLEALQALGARPWPNPSDTDNLLKTLANTPAESRSLLQTELDLAKSSGKEASSIQQGAAPKDALFGSVRLLIDQLLETPMNDQAIAEALDVKPSQAKDWLNRLTAEGSIRKLKRPVCYVRATTGRTRELF